MRTEIPINDVKRDYKKALQELIAEVISKNTDNVVSIYLTGSYARGDASDSSDLDVFFIFSNLDSQVLYSVGMAARETSIAYEQLEINPQCMTLNEFKNLIFENWSETSVVALDSVLLYGKDISSSDISTEEIEVIYKKYLVEVLMSIRHYMSVDKPIEKLTHQRIKTYVLKPLMFALRLERYCKTSSYPLSIMDLLNSYKDEYKILVEYFMNKERFDKDIQLDHKKVFETLHTLISSLIAK